MDAVADAEYDHASAAVDGVARGDEFPAGLERVMHRWRPRARLAVNAEDAADGNQAVDVGGAVERVEANDVFALKDRTIT